MISWIVENKEAGGRLDKFVKSRLKAAPDSFIYKMARKKNLTLNGSKCTAKEILKGGDVIRLFVSDETVRLFTGESANSVTSEEYIKAYQSLKGIEVLKETEDVLFLNKPSGILSQKAKEGDISLNEWLIGYLLSKETINEASLKTFRPSVCNRLDRNTSGIVLCGITPLGSRVLSALLKERTLHKYYLTLVSGKCDLDGLYEGYLYKDEAKNIVTFKENLDAFDKKLQASAKKVSLRIEVLKAEDKKSLLKIELLTGKSHQIRVMLSYFSFPIVGDAKYGKSGIKDGQLLHAYQVVFPEKVPEIPYLSDLTVTSDAPFDV